MKKHLSFFTGLIFFAAVFASGIYGENIQKTVRVGYYFSDLFQEGTSDDELKSGYGYEYILRVADYNGWKYKYVYGDWANLIEMLQTGEIDLLAGVSYTKERSEKILYPDYQMGTERYYLFQKEDSGTMNPDDFRTIEGKTIGAVRNNRFTYYLMEWAKKNNVNINVRNYDGFVERDADFAEGKLDGIVATDNNISSKSKISPVVKVGEEPFYLAVTKKRPDLMADLNRSLNIMHEIEPYFIETIQFRNFGETSTSNRLSEPEQKWVNEHSELRIGYLNNYLPYCDSKNGKATGLITDVMTAIIDHLKLDGKVKVSYKCYSSSGDMIEALNDGEVDAVFPIGGMLWLNEKDGITATNPVVNCGTGIIFKGNYDESKFTSFAVNKNNRMQYYFVLSNYPDAEIVFYDSIEDCVRAVRDGKVKATTINGLRMDILTKDENFKDLSFFLQEVNDVRNLGIKSGNSSLLILLNRGLKLIGRDYGVSASYNYIEYNSSFGFREFLRRNSLNVVVCVILVFLIIVFLLAVNIYRMKKESEAQKKYLEEIKRARDDSMVAQIQSSTDELTKFLNRRAYESFISMTADTDVADNFTIVSLDINGLKTVNDSFGHSAGDELIIGAASCIKKAFGALGSIYRVGGDEFAVLMNASREQLDEAVIALKNLTKEWKGELVSELFISVGAASRLDFKGESVSQIEKIADKRMYEDKSLFYSNRRDRRGSSRSAFTNVLRCFIKVLKVDILTDTFQVIKMNEDEQGSEKGFTSGIFEWLKTFGNAGQVHEEDLPEYLEKTSAENIKNYFKDEKNEEPLKIIYRRKAGDDYKKVLLEMSRADDYSENNQVLYLFVKEI